MGPAGLRLLFTSGLHWGWILPALAAGALAVGWAYDRRVRRLAAGRWPYLAACRAGAVVCILLLLLRPELDLQLSRVEAQTLVLLWDCSASLGLADSPAGPSRHRQAAALLAEAERRLSRTPYLTAQIVPFAATCAPAISADDLPAVEPAGHETNLTAALQGALGAPHLRRVVLLSDGNDTTGLDPLAAAAQLKLPLDAVVLGKPTGEKQALDVAVANVDAPPAARLGSVAQLAARIVATGAAGRSAVVTLQDGERALAKAEIVLDDSPDGQTVPLNLQADRPGLLDLTVSVSPLAGETVLANNQCELPLEITPKLPRVLYLEGALRPEYKFLRRALAGDPGLEIDGLVRASAGEYLRQGPSGASAAALPATAAELAVYEVVILGELPAELNAGPFAALLAEAVAGGQGVLFLPGTGGLETLAAPPLGKLPPALPALPRLNAGRPFLGPAGRATPLGETLGQLFPPAEGGRAELPALGGVLTAGALQPGAAVVLAADYEKHEIPVLVTSTYGQGKTAIFLGLDSWRWGLGPAAERQAQERLWGQVLRWLAGDATLPPVGTPTLRVQADRLVADPGQPFTFSAVLGGGDPDLAAQVTAEPVASPAGTNPPARLSLAQTPGLPHHYSAQLALPRPGAYRFKFAAAAGDKKLAEREIALRVRSPQGEFSRQAPNVKLLGDLCRATGGELLTPETFPAWLDHLLTEENRRLEMRRIPLWHAAGLFIAAVLLLTLEWLGRKLCGLS